MEKKCDMIGCRNASVHSVSIGPGTVVFVCDNCFIEMIEIKKEGVKSLRTDFDVIDEAKKDNKEN